MKTAVWYGQKDIRIEDKELKPLKDNEVTVRVAWAGICGSDLHEYQEGPVFVPVDAPDELIGEVAPIIMGHEFAGVVEKVGSAVKKYKVGDRVVVNPTITHGNKPEDIDCYDGFSFIGLHGDGGFTTFANAPEHNIYKLPDTLTLQDGALGFSALVGTNLPGLEITKASAAVQEIPSKIEGKVMEVSKDSFVLESKQGGRLVTVHHDFQSDVKVGEYVRVTSDEPL